MPSPPPIKWMDFDTNLSNPSMNRSDMCTSVFCIQ